MSNIQEIIAIIFMAFGLFFLVISAAGMLRLPDFYSRLHASGNSETLGLMLTLIGLIIYEGFSLMAFKLVFVFLFVFIGNPIGTHILSRTARKIGYPVWTRTEKESSRGDAERIAAGAENEHEGEE